jgi:hypothetical protein
VNFQYWVIRFVPNVARGEFSNIGIVCGSDDGDWAIEFDLKSVRSHGNLSNDLRELNGWVSWFRRTVEEYSDRPAGDRQLSTEWVEHLRVRQANSVQFSEPLPINVGSAAEGVALLFPHLVERVSIRRKPGLSRRRLRVEVRDTLAHEAGYVVGRDLFSSPKFQVGRQRGEFDFVRYVGPDEVLTNVWAFNVATLDLLERDIQSWNYLVSRLRNNGAKLIVVPKSNSSVSLDAGSPIDVVYDPPSQGSNGRRMEIFEAALEAWDLSDVSARTLGDFRASLPVA